MKLFVVESAARASLLSGIAMKMPDVRVISCNGAYAGLPKNQRVFDPKSNFTPKYSVRDSKTLSRLREAMSAADEVVAFTLGDDDGEFIAHQLSITAGLVGKKFLRCRATELTESSVLSSLSSDLPVNEHQVNAYLAREAIDRFISFEILPLVRKRLGPGVGGIHLHTAFLLNLLARRERKLRGGTSHNLWSIQATLEDGSISESVSLFASEGEALSASEQVGASVPSYTSARRAVPAPEPFNTSSLLRFLATRYAFSPSKSLDFCDALYSMGMITYPYTSSATFSCSATDRIRDFISKTFGSSLLSGTPQFSSSSQEEAIRPVSIKLSPADSSLGGDLRTVYSAVWFRSLATQGSSYICEDQECTHETSDPVLRATGVRVVDLGWHQLSSKLFFDSRQTIDDSQLSVIDYGVVPKISTNARRHTYGSLLRKLDEAMIGRPTTYRSAFSSLVNDGYAVLHGGTLRITLRGEALVTFLRRSVPDLLDADFCAELEEEIDSVRSGSSLSDFMHHYWDWTQRSCSMISTKYLRPRFRCPDDDSALRVWLPSKSDPVVQSASTSWFSPFCFDSKGQIVLTQRTQ